MRDSVNSELPLVKAVQVSGGLVKPLECLTNAIKVNEAREGRSLVSNYGVRRGQEIALMNRDNQLELYMMAARGIGILIKLALCGKENLYFPQVGFNESFFNWAINRKPKEPFLSYVLTIVDAHAGICAHRIVEIPQLLEPVERYRVAKSPELQEQLKLLEECCRLDEPLVIPSKDGSLLEVAGILKTQIQEKDHTQTLKERIANACMALWEVLEGKAKKPASSVAKEAFGNTLAGYFYSAIKHNQIDSYRKEQRYLKHEIPESKIDAYRNRKARGTEVDIPFLDTLPGQELEQPDWEIEEQEEKLKELFATAGLTKMERLVVDLRREGYDYEGIAANLSSKLGKKITSTLTRKHFSNAKKKLKPVVKK